MIKKKDLSQSDKKAWEEYIKDPSDIYDKDQNSNKNKKRKDRYKFDLHGLTLNDANKKTKEIILSCFRNRYKEVLLITGKGIHSTNDKDIYISKDLGKLKFSVPEFIKSDEDLKKIIISINKAEIIDGGDGAVLIKLRDLQNKL